MSATPKIIESVSFKDVIECLADNNIQVIHATNGTFMHPQESALPTTAAGFQYIKDHIAKLGDAFVVALNSDVSMTDEWGEKKCTENQRERGDKVAVPLAQHFNSKHPVIIMRYDEETPLELYQSFSKAENLRLRTLFKCGGYGIGKNAPVIVGAELFENTLAFPFHNKDAKPVCFNETRRATQSGIQVVDLYKEQGPHGQPYLKHENGLDVPLFNFKTLG